jgi:hypothetical protein
MARGDAEGERRRAVGGRGVREGSPLLPLLFSVETAGEAREESQAGVGGQLAKCVGLADDQAMVSQSRKGLRALVDASEVHCGKRGVEINCKKSNEISEGKEGEVVDASRGGAEAGAHFNYFGRKLKENGHFSGGTRERMQLIVGEGRLPWSGGRRVSVEGKGKGFFEGRRKGEFAAAKAPPFVYRREMMARTPRGNVEEGRQGVKCEELEQMEGEDRHLRCECGGEWRRSGGG